MRLSILGFITITILMLTSCQKDDSTVNDKSTADTELILSIQKATNKQTIDVSKLPSASKEILVQEYNEDYVDAAKLAPKLGYEVDLRCERGPNVGERRQAYFDLRGRVLRDNREKGDKENGNKRRCFELILPVTFIMPDDSEITVGDKEDWGLIKSWYKAHPDVKKRPEIQFPVEIKWQNGKIITINNQEEMRKAKARCKDDKAKCLRLVLPVTYTMPDGSEITIEKREDRLLIRAWYEAHPDVKRRPVIQYPVEIKWRDGTVETINNSREMKTAVEKCEDKEKD